MELTPEGKLVRTDAWREGEYLDLWSIPHLLSGILVAFALFFLGFEVRSAFVIAFLLLVGYELFEAVAEIEETRWNRILDVVVGMASFTPTFLLLPQIETQYAIPSFTLIFCLDAVLSYFGWRASQKAAVLERKLRAEVLHEFQRFARRRAAFRENWKKRRSTWRMPRK